MPSQPLPLDSQPSVSHALASVDRSAFVVGVASYAGRSHPPTNALALMIQALRVTPRSKVLLVGAGSGYAAAALAKVCHHVWAIDRVESLVAAARTRLEKAGIDNVTLRSGDGREGWPQQAPFDAILLLSTVGGIPIGLLDQLAPGAALVMAVGAHRAEQTLLRLTRRSEGPPQREELGTVDFSGEKPEAGSSSEAQRPPVGVDDPEAVRSLATAHAMKFGTLGDLLRQLDPKLFEQVPRAFCDHHRLLPICRDGDVIRVASTRPDAPFSDLGHVFTGQRIEPWLVTSTDFRRIWSALELRLAGESLDVLTEEDPSIAADLLDRGDKEVEARAVSLFEALLLDAIGERASDLHLERYGDRTRVRIRVDGDLRDLTRYQLSTRDFVGIVNVIKIRAHLDISERRLPQGGRSRVGAGGKAYDLRVQTQPSLHGEHVIVRILPQQQRLLTIEGLGFPAQVAERYRRLVDSPAGLVLVVGPTGSGKSTTLYAALQVLARDETRKVITIEDPIEYSLEGIQQVQVKPEIGFGFSSAMRAFVRQDPDVILVGEIRDAETALEAMRASQTGHLVLSTLHCNDATDAAQRLLDLGMHPNTIASELLAVISQRLAKRICEHCREPAQPDPALVAEAFPKGVPEGFRFFAGKGCDRCEGEGTHGRIAVIEFMRASPEVRRAISRQATVDELRRVALDSGLITARDSALAHVDAGVIALEELPYLVPAERLGGEAT